MTCSVISDQPEQLAGFAGVDRPGLQSRMVQEVLVAADDRLGVGRGSAVQPPVRDLVHALRMRALRMVPHAEGQVMQLRALLHHLDPKDHSEMPRRWQILFKAYSRLVPPR